jgi:hypothetical protein
MSTRIACSPLTGTIYTGRVNKTGTHFIGEKRDVTSDVMGALISKAEFHGGAFQIRSGDYVWDVSVTKRESDAGGEA